MSISTAELQTNLSKYLLLSENEDIYIMENGKIISKLSNPYKERLDIVNSLFGILPADITVEEAREERLSKI